MGKKNVKPVPTQLVELKAAAKTDKRDFFIRINQMAGSSTLALLGVKNTGIAEVMDKDGNTRIFQHNCYAPPLEISQYFNSSQPKCLIAIDDDGEIWRAAVNVSADVRVARTGNMFYLCSVKVSNIYVGDWTPAHGPILFEHVYLFPKEMAKNMLREKNPYAAAYAEERNFPAINLLLAPHLEQLSKCGYAFADAILENRSWNLGRSPEATKETFVNRLIKPGTSPKDIFKCPMEMAEALKKERDISVWDVYRKLVATGKLKASQVGEAFAHNYRKDELEKINSILCYEWEGKRLFTWDTLLRYLERLDNFEAIPFDEAIQLLKDYIRCCRVVGCKPRVDGDSLKREHDVTARTARIKAQELRSVGFEAACEKNARFNYSESTYFARAIRDFDDLVDEASQQHNCLVGYQASIGCGHSLVMVVRCTDSPDKSLASVELSPKTGQIRQKLLSYNRPIRNPELSDFIDRLSDHVRDVAKNREPELIAAQ